jgi:hypothetical protein
MNDRFCGSLPVSILENARYAFPTRSDEVDAIAGVHDGLGDPGLRRRRIFQAGLAFAVSSNGLDVETFRGFQLAGELLHLTSFF